MKTSPSIVGWAACALLLLASGAWIAWRAEPPATRVAESARPARPASSPARVAPVAATPPQTSAITPPEGMTPTQWQMLRDQLKDHPQREAEIARISAAVTYLSRLDRFRTQRQQTDAKASPADREQAAWLLDQLPARVANREVSGSEARRLNEALLDALAATPAERESAQQALAAALPADPDLLARAARDLRYQRESAALLATWQARPAAARDPQQLEASLLALRLSLFNQPASADATAGVLR